MEAATIRPARVADAGQVALVHVRSWQGAYRGLLPQDYLDGLDPGQRLARWQQSLTETSGPRAGTLVAERDGNLLGFTSYSSSRDEDADPDRVGEIAAIYLLPEAWGGGAGRRLMAAALGRLTRAGFDQGTLWVLDSNVRARRFYEAGGWAPDGAVKRDERFGFPVSEVRYRKLLSA